MVNTSLKRGEEKRRGKGKEGGEERGRRGGERGGEGGGRREGRRGEGEGRREEKEEGHRMYVAVFHASPLARGGYISSVEMCV